MALCIVGSGFCNPLLLQMLLAAVGRCWDHSSKASKRFLGVPVYDVCFACVPACWHHLQVESCVP